MNIRKHACIGQTHIIREKQFAFLFRNERGYTFLNLLLSFFIYSIIIASITIIFHFLLTHSQHPNDLKQYEWELFIMQLHRELKEASDMTVYEAEVTFTNNQGELVSINHYQNLIRRQIAGRGHEIFLLKVKNATFLETNSGVKLSVESQSGKNYHYTFRLYKGKAEV